MVTAPCQRPGSSFFPSPLEKQGSARPPPPPSLVLHSNPASPSLASGGKGVGLLGFHQGHPELDRVQAGPLAGQF